MAKKTRVTGARTRTTYDSAAREGAKKNMARMRRSASKANRAMGGEGKDIDKYENQVDQRLRAGERTVHVQNRSMYNDDRSMPGRGKAQKGFMPSKTVTKLTTNKPTSGRDIPLPKSKF
jgi:hypothetical protein